MPRGLTPRRFTMPVSVTLVDLCKGKDYYVLGRPKNMADGNSTLDGRQRFARRILEETAREGALGVVNESFAGDELVQLWDQGDVFGLPRRLGVSGEPVGRVETA